jgi:hypothetical protein
MITRGGRTVLEDIREYWGEFTEQVTEPHRAALRPTSTLDSKALSQLPVSVDYVPPARRVPSAREA